MTTNIEHKGKWRLPQSEEWFDGTLTFDPNIGARLEIFGSFNSTLLNTSDIEIVLGETTAGDITLIDNWHRKKKANSNGIILETYEPIFIIVGHHFTQTENICFRNVKFRAFNLFQWLDQTGLKFESEHSYGNYNISFEKREPIRFELNESCKGEISFESSYHNSDFYNKIELSEQASVALSFSEKTHYETILENIRVFIGYLTLCTFEQSYAIDISFKDNDFTEKYQRNERVKFIKCIYRNNGFSHEYKLRRKHEHLVKYKDIHEKFQESIKKWFELHKNIEPVFTLMLFKFRNKQKFSTDLFMDNVRALESYHRYTHNNARIPEEQYKHKIQKILEAVELNVNDKNWLSQKLKYGNEPSLNIRLKELIKENQNSFIKDNLASYKRFCQSVVDNRNFYTHYDKDLEKKSLNGRELYELNRKIEGILYSCVLKDLGLENEKFEKGLKYHLNE